MTREEEIHKAAEEFAFRNITKSSDFRNAMNDFYYGAEWADKHPKRYNQDELCDIQLEMMRQRDKRLIAKACKWLKDNIDFEHNYQNSKEELINDFKKAMEK